MTYEEQHDAWEQGDTVSCKNCPKELTPYYAYLSPIGLLCLECATKYYEREG